MDHFEFVHKMTKAALDHQAKQADAATGVQHLDIGGTLSGALEGSLLGPVGTQIGAIAGSGGASGLPGGGIAGALGLTNNYQAQGAPITPGTSADQLSTAYTGAQSGLNQTQGVANTLTPGVSQGANTEATLAGQLNNEANGQGPNPAAAELNQATGQNVQQTAALLASQRGAGTNAGLIGANAARTGANTQQAAVGQAATLSAEQQLAAQQAAANLAATQVNQGQSAIQGVNQQQQGEQTILQNANTANNNANVTATGNVNNTNASVASGNQAANQSLIGGALGGLSSIAAAFAKGGIVRMDRGGNVLDAHARSQISKDNFALPGGRYPIHDATHARNALARVSQYGTPAEKAKVKAAVAKKYPEMMQKKAEGGPIESPTTPSLGMTDCKPRADKGYGAVICKADGGPIDGNPLTNSVSAIQPRSFVGQWLNNPTVDTGSTNIQAGPASDSKVSSKPLAGMSSLGDLIPSGGSEEDNSTGEIAGGPDSIDLSNAGKMNAAHGGKVPGKAAVNQDSLKNDKVPYDVAGGGKAMLSPGELVVDLDTMKDPGPMGKLARALARHIEAKKAGRSA